MAEQPKQTDVQSAASKTRAAAVDKKTFPHHISNQNPPKPAPRTIISAERVKSHILFKATNYFDFPGIVVIFYNVIIDNRGKNIGNINVVGKLKHIIKVFCFVCQVKTQLYQPPELPCLGPLQVHVSSIGEDGLIYVRTHNAGNYS